MSSLKVFVPMSAVILAIFGVLLGILLVKGTGEESGATPTPTPTAIVTPLGR